MVEDAKICEDARKVGRDGLGLVGAEKEGGGDEVRLEEPKIFGEDTREEAGGKGRGQTDGAQASEETVWNPAAPATGATTTCACVASCGPPRAGREGEWGEQRNLRASRGDRAMRTE